MDNSRGSLVASGASIEDLLPIKYSTKPKKEIKQNLNITSTYSFKTSQGKSKDLGDPFERLSSRRNYMSRTLLKESLSNSTYSDGKDKSQSTSKSMVNPNSRKLTEELQPLEERQAMLIEKRQNIIKAQLEQRQEAEDKKVASCPFKPQIDERSKTLGQRTNFEQWAKKRDHDRRTVAENVDKQTAVECTFQPKLCEESVSILRRKQEGAEAENYENIYYVVNSRK